MTRAQRAAQLPRWKKMLFPLLPAIALLLCAEGVVRIGGLAGTRYQTIPLPEEFAGLLGADPDLFWSLRPNLDMTYMGVRVTSNSRGLRSPEVRPREANEFRVLSLGESSTFGVGVADDETYTALLPAMLQQKYPARRFTALNAGVSAWSSFQSLKYLELRGLELEPDLVLFYHELNDYLPSTLRDSSRTEVSARKTDRELYESRTHRIARSLANVSALFRSLRNHYARWSMRRADRATVGNPLTGIGLPDTGVANRLAPAGEELRRQTEVNERSLGQRVSADERRRTLHELSDLCQANGVSLVIIHPAYQSTARHACALTAFCGEHGVPMFEALDALHVDGADTDPAYGDTWHPSRRGHRLLAQGLAEFLHTNRLVE